MSTSTTSTTSAQAFPQATSDIQPPAIRTRSFYSFNSSPYSGEKLMLDIKLVGPKDANERVIQDIKLNGQSYKWIRLTDCTVLKSHCEIIANCIQASRLEFNRCIFEDEDALVRMFSKLPNLFYLRIESSNPSEQVLSAIANSFPLLRTLDLTSSLNLNNHLLMMIAGYLPYLKMLVLNGCIHVDDSGISAVVENCPYLEKLHIDSCTKITRASIEPLQQLLFLKGLSTKCCKNLKNELLRRSFPHIRHFGKNDRPLGPRICKTHPLPYHQFIMTGPSPLPATSTSSSVKPPERQFNDWSNYSFYSVKPQKRQINHWTNYSFSDDHMTGERKKFFQAKRP